MSQFGAKGLADQGWPASSILKHFYQGTELQRVGDPAEVRIGLLQGQSDIAITSDGPFDLSGSGGSAQAQAGQTWHVSPDPVGNLVVRNEQGLETFTSPPPVTLSYEPHNVAVRLPQTGYRYKRGRIDIDAYPTDQGSRARAILLVGVEKYLYGLGEVPSSWPAETLKAQAVAARTYALEKARRNQNRPGCNCALYASTIDQAYVGYEKEAGAGGEKWTNAVDDTAGLAVTTGGKPIQAFYSSSDGGHSENNEYVWGGEPLPYLRGVCDPGDATDANPNSEWSVRLDEPDLRSKLQSGGIDVGTIERVEFVDPRGVSGRLTPVSSAEKGGVKVVGSSSSARLSGDRFRSLVGLKSTLIFRQGAGYRLVGADGGIFTFGDASYAGSMRGRPLAKPIVAMASSPVGGLGYWLAASDGGVFTFGNVCYYGSMGGKPLDKPIVAMAPTRSGGGYMLAASDGGMFTFGDAKFRGSMGGRPLDKPIVGMAPTPSGNGYWLVASDGGIFSFGDARFRGSMGGKQLVSPMVGMAPTPSGNGYWTVAADGGVFTFGDATFYGSIGGRPLDKPIVSMSATPGGTGYWLGATDGGMFTFGDAPFLGSLGGRRLVSPIVWMAAS
jgi:SpoIID/LytB domain protein